MAVSQIILTNQDELSPMTGEKFKGDGYYGYADGSAYCKFSRHTVL